MNLNDIIRCEEPLETGEGYCFRLGGCTGPGLVQKGKSILSEHIPYVIETDPETDVKTIVFMDHFICAWRTALTYEGDPIGDFGMSPDEVDLWNSFIDYERLVDDADVRFKPVEHALDFWAYEEILGNPHPEPSTLYSCSHPWVKNEKYEG